MDVCHWNEHTWTNKIKRACVCMRVCSLNKHTRILRLKERQTIIQTHSHSYKRTPPSSPYVKCIQHYFFLLRLFYSLRSSSLFASQLCCFDGLCLVHLFHHSLTHSLAPFIICGVWCLTKFEIWLFLRFLLVALILIYLYPHISCIICIRYQKHTQHIPLYTPHTLHTARETQRKITSTQIHWIETVMRLLWKTLELFFHRNRSRISFQSIHDAYTIQLTKSSSKVFPTNALQQINIFESPNFMFESIFFSVSSKMGWKNKKNKIQKKRQCVCLATDKRVCAACSMLMFMLVCEVREKENHHSYKINVNDRSTWEIFRHIWLVVWMMRVHVWV